MKHTPILFSTDMVRAILNGKKTQTRRVIKTEIENPGLWHLNDSRRLVNILSGQSIKSPFGKPGDILWVRETIINNWQTARFPYRAQVCSKYDKPDCTEWIPSIFMPRAACRLFLKITDIRVERLQDISADDAIKEGVECDTEVRENTMNYKSYISNNFTAFPYVSFLTLWHKINGRASWEANPWVWVIEFERCEKPENF